MHGLQANRTNAIALILLLTLVLAALPLNTAYSQEHVRYKVETKTNIESLGVVGDLLSSGLKEEVSISGNLKRVDRGDVTTITNIDKREITNIDHDKKEYSIVTFDEMTEILADATILGEAKAEEAQESMENEEVPEYTVSFNLSIEEPGTEEKVDGRKTIQKVVVIETIFEPTDEAARDTLPSTSLYAINDLRFAAKEIPEMAANTAFNENLGKAFSEDFNQKSNMSTLISTLLKTDPRVGEAMEKIKESAAELTGTVLLSTLRIVTVPPEKTLDLALALEDKKKEGGGGFGGFLKKAAESQVGMGGEEEQKEPEQSTLVKITSKTKDINNKERKRDYFEPRDDYDLIEFELPKLLEAMNAED